MAAVRGRRSAAAAATLLFGASLLLSAPRPGASLDAFQYLGQAYRKNMIPFREDPLFGDRPILDEYDFVVVGAGAAGATVARRLAEVPGWTVLLLEAGGQESLATTVPAIAHYLQFTGYNWAYRTEPEPRACRGLTGAACPWPAGRGLGGSTIINNNMYTRGNVRDFDRWAEAGNAGWSYADVLPYFVKNEDVNVPELKRSAYHGVGGPVPVSYPPFKSKLCDAFLASAAEARTRVADYNAPGSHVAFSRVQSTTLNGRRVTAARAYLHDRLDNLHVVEYGHVTRVLIDGAGRASGVEFVKRKRKRRVAARKEVIVSAGTFNSAKLLMLSGVGPKEHLDRLGIRTVSDLRVGDNLQEHPAYAGLLFVINQTESFVPDRVFRHPIEEALKFLDQKSWMSMLPPEAVGYVKTKYNRDPGDVPDIEYIFLPGSLAGEGGLGATMARRSMGIPDKLFYGSYKNSLNKDSWSIWPMLMYPESRGQVRLRSANPFDKPVINANFFADPMDLNRIVEAIKMIIELSKTKAFQRLGSTLPRDPLVGCGHLEFGSDPYWACCVQTMTMQMHHQSGTCKMGPKWDRNAVVDAQLRVYGVDRLRVIDCSIMPTITGAHTVAPAYMIGEKGADLVKHAWLTNGTSPSR